jgi:hypothetical protein
MSKTKEPSFPMYDDHGKQRVDHSKITKSQEKLIFEEACIGYGFEEVEQEADGLYCTGCYVIHKRPTKMYSGGMRETLCKFQVIRLYNPFDEV